MEKINKKCSKCGNIKDSLEFNKDKSRKSGLQSKCKLCRLEYRDKNKEKILKQKKEYRIKNYIKCNMTTKTRHKTSKKKYCKNNSEKLLLKQLIRQKERKLKDQLYRLKCNLRSTISSNIKKSGYSKKSKTHKILGCNYEDFKQHLEGLFESWMNWGNYGLYNGQEKYGWDIDHFVPLASAKTEEELLKLCHFCNLQPLCSYTNRVIKREKLIIK